MLQIYKKKLNDALFCGFGTVQTLLAVNKFILFNICHMAHKTDDKPTQGNALGYGQDALLGRIKRTC